MIPNGPPPPRRVALYARVSTQEGRQHLENQLAQLRNYVPRMKWRTVATFTDQGSGAKDRRPGLDRMMEAAVRRDFDIVLVYDLSRLTRRGPATAFEYIERLNAAGVQFHSFREEYFRTTGPAGPMLIAIAAYIAQQEREQMQDRIKAGVARGKANGVVFGRPKRIIDSERIRILRGQGHSIRQIAQKLKTSRSIIHRCLQSLQEKKTK
jgi:DNA invertase Pin-like site-specific DNA recombinase